MSNFKILGGAMLPFPTPMDVLRVQALLQVNKPTLNFYVWSNTQNKIQDEKFIQMLSAKGASTYSTYSFVVHLTLSVAAFIELIVAIVMSGYGCKVSCCPERVSSIHI